MRAIFLIALMALMGCGPTSVAPADPGVGRDDPIIYQTAHRYRAFWFSRDLRRFELNSSSNGRWEGGEQSYPTENCSDENVLCISYVSGPVILAVARDIETTDRWGAGDYTFNVVLRTRGRADNDLIFVEMTSSSEPSWRQQFAYETGIGVTSITINMDDETKLYETGVLVGNRGLFGEAG